MAPSEPVLVLPTAEETALDIASAPNDGDLRCPFYCEENVWRLAYRKMKGAEANKDRHPQHRDYYVAFISNERKNVPMFYQRASSDKDKPCIWDYHVILIAVDKKGNANKLLVYDVDSTLSPYPMALDQYLSYSFSDELSATAFAPLFRVIPAALYLQYFESDRSHMYNAHTSSWSAPPPPYQCIFTSTTSPSSKPTTSTRSNLKQYLNFGEPSVAYQDPLPSEALGVVLKLKQLREFA